MAKGKHEIMLDDETPVALLDIDETVLFNYDKLQDEPMRNALNKNLLNALLDANPPITDLYLFTDMKLKEDDIRERIELIELLEEYGFTVHGVITPSGIAWARISDQEVKNFYTKVEGSLDYRGTLNGDDFIKHVNFQEEIDTIKTIITTKYDPSKDEPGKAFKEASKELNKDGKLSDEIQMRGRAVKIIGDNLVGDNSVIATNKEEMYPHTKGLMLELFRQYHNNPAVVFDDKQEVHDSIEIFKKSRSSPLSAPVATISLVPPSDKTAFSIYKENKLKYYTKSYFSNHIAEFQKEYDEHLMKEFKEHAQEQRRDEKIVTTFLPLIKQLATLRSKTKQLPESWSEDREKLHDLENNIKEAIKLFITDSETSSRIATDEFITTCNQKIKEAIKLSIIQLDVYGLEDSRGFKNLLLDTLPELIKNIKEEHLKKYEDLLNNLLTALEQKSNEQEESPTVGENNTPTLEDVPSFDLEDNLASSKDNLDDLFEKGICFSKAQFKRYANLFDCPNIYSALEPALTQLEDLDAKVESLTNESEYERAKQLSKLAIGIRTAIKEYMRDNKNKEAQDKFTEKCSTLINPIETMENTLLRKQRRGHEFLGLKEIGIKLASGIAKLIGKTFSNKKAMEFSRSITQTSTEKKVEQLSNKLLMTEELKQLEEGQTLTGKHKSKSIFRDSQKTKIKELNQNPLSLEEQLVVLSGEASKLSKLVNDTFVALGLHQAILGEDNKKHVICASDFLPLPENLLVENYAKEQAKQNANISQNLQKIKELQKTLDSEYKKLKQEIIVEKQWVSGDDQQHRNRIAEMEKQMYGIMSAMHAHLGSHQFNTEQALKKEGKPFETSTIFEESKDRTEILLQFSEHAGILLPSEEGLTNQQKFKRRIHNGNSTDTEYSPPKTKI